ncbi:MAG: class I SAM-dependent methyltransferase [Nitrososphaerales archaeon]|nr:class I SAM-dependent methyltransferase [Nitrososphaerales archaeon]
MQLDEVIRFLTEKWNRHSASYDKIMVPIFRSYEEEVVKRADIKRGYKVLDIGTGTGLAALLAASIVGQEGLVIGVDIAEAFLQLARANADKLGLGHVVFERMDASSLQYLDENFDAVISNLGIYLKCGLILKETHKVLKPGRVLSFSSGGPKPPEPVKVFEQLLAKYQRTLPPPELAAYREAQGIARKESEQYRQPSRMENELRVTGFRFIEAAVKSRKLLFPSVQNYLDTFLIGWCYNQAEFDAISPESKLAFREEALDALKGYVTGEGFAVDTQIIYYKAVR